MCTFPDQPSTGVDHFFLESPVLTEFIEQVNEIRAAESDPRAIVAAIQPHFERILADPDWLSAEFQESKANSGMGGGIGMWLLFRAGDGTLAFSSLVVPPGAQTPVHDHLAWGIVGLYRGTQDEEVFVRQDDGTSETEADLTVVESRGLEPGDFYELLPENDIHRVRTTSPTTSVSLHLLGNDNGCIWRHRFHLDERRVEPFKSGWLNSPCEESQAAD